MIDNYLALVVSLKLIREALEEAFGAAAELPASIRAAVSQTARSAAFDAFVPGSSQYR